MTGAQTSSALKKPWESSLALGQKDVDRSSVGSRGILYVLHVGFPKLVF